MHISSKMVKIVHAIPLMFLGVSPFRFWYWGFLLSTPPHCPFTNLIKEQTSGFFILSVMNLLSLSSKFSLLCSALWFFLTLGHINIYHLAVRWMLNWINRWMGTATQVSFRSWYVCMYVLLSGWSQIIEERQLCSLAMLCPPAAHYLHQETSPRVSISLGKDRSPL